MAPPTKPVNPKHLSPPHSPLMRVLRSKMLCLRITAVAYALVNHTVLVDPPAHIYIVCSDWYFVLEVK